MTAGREPTPEFGTCSVCGAACERVESGAWWHLDASCYGSAPWYAAPVFVPSPAREAAS